jgi:hypothetical protein
MGFQPVQSDVAKQLNEPPRQVARTGQAGSPSHFDSLEGCPTTSARPAKKARVSKATERCYHQPHATIDL